MAYIVVLNPLIIGTVPDKTGALLGIPKVAAATALVFVLGLLVTAILVARRVKGAILIGIIGSTILAIIVEAIVKAGPTVVRPGVINDKGWSLNVPKLPGIHHIAGTPDLSLVGHF